MLDLRWVIPVFRSTTMADSTRLYFLDMGLTNNKDGVLQGRIMTCNSRGEELKCLVDGLKAMPGKLMWLCRK